MKFGSFFFTLCHVGICCEPSGLKPVLPSGTCVLRRLSPFGFPADSKFPSLPTGVRKDQKPQEQGAAVVGEEESNSPHKRREHKKTNTKLFLVDS